MAARITAGSSSSGESTYSADTSYQTKTSFSHTPTANTTVVIFYSALIANASTSFNTGCRLRNSTSGTTLCESSFNPRDTTDYVHVSGMAVESYGASPASQTYTLDYSTSNTGGAAKIKNAEIVLLELHADDFTAVADGPHLVTDTNYVTGVTMTETFANGVDYYIVAMAEPTTTSTSPRPEIEARYDGATSYGTMDHDFASSSEVGTWMTVFKITGTGASKSIIIRCRSSSTIDVGFRKARILALRADRFDASFYDESRARATTTSTTYQDKVTSTHTLAAVEHIVLGGGIIDCGSTTQSALCQLDEDGSSQGEHIHEANTTGASGGGMSYQRAYRKTFSAGSHTLKTQYKAETSATMGLAESAILILQTGSSGTTGTAATSEAADTASASGNETFTGTAAAVEAADTASATGLAGVRGSAAVTAAADTSAASGTETFTGTAAAVEAEDTASGTATEAFTGTAAIAEAADTAGAAGLAGIRGSGATSSADHTAEASGLEIITGTASVTGASDTASASGEVTSDEISGSASATAAAHTAAGTGTEIINGSASTTEAADSASGAGTLAFTGTGAVTEAADTASGSGAEIFTGTAATSAAADTASGSGSLAITGSATATEAEDTATGSGVLLIAGSGATTQASDTASGTGSAASAITGAAAIIAASDTAFGEALTYLASDNYTYDVPAETRSATIEADGRVVTVVAQTRTHATPADGRTTTITSDTRTHTATR